MPTETRAAISAPPIRPVLRLRYSRFLNVVFALFIVCGAIAFIQPSPYDLLSLVVMPLWFIGGFRVRRGVVPFVVLIVLYDLAGFIALVPYWNEHDPRIFMLRSLYLTVTAVFFVLFFSERTSERIALCLKAFAASTIIGAVAAIAGYFDLGNTADIFARYGRAAGTFKDPNVLGSYLIMGALYFLQSLIFGRGRLLVLFFALFLVDLVGILLSFSRGSEAASFVAISTMVALTFVTTHESAKRWRIVAWVAGALLAGALVLFAVLSIGSVHQLFLARFQAPGEEYRDPRFLNQLHALPMLLSRPNGFGPLRFRLWFYLDPHSSYVNAFASYGWFGGFTFLTIIGTTMFVGFRLALTRSPFQRLALVVWPALMVLLLQGFQIDIDHWRHVYLMLGMVWGMEAARAHWSQIHARAVPASPAAARRSKIAPDREPPTSPCTTRAKIVARPEHRRKQIEKTLGANLS